MCLRELLLRRIASISVCKAVFSLTALTETGVYVGYVQGMSWRRGDSRSCQLQVISLQTIFTELLFLTLLQN